MPGESLDGSQDDGNDGSQEITPPATLDLLEHRIASLQRNRRTRIHLKIFFPILLFGSAADAAGFMPPPPKAPPLGWNAHRLSVYGCTVLCGLALVLNGRRQKITDQELQDMADRGQLEDMLKQLLRENPDQREMLQGIALRYRVLCPDLWEQFPEWED